MTIAEEFDALAIEAETLARRAGLHRGSGSHHRGAAEQDGIARESLPPGDYARLRYAWARLRTLGALPCAEKTPEEIAALLGGDSGQEHTCGQRNPFARGGWVRVSTAVFLRERGDRLEPLREQLEAEGRRCEYRRHVYSGSGEELWALWERVLPGGYRPRMIEPPERIPKLTTEEAVARFVRAWRGDAA